MRSGGKIEPPFNVYVQASDIVVDAGVQAIPWGLAQALPEGEQTPPWQEDLPPALLRTVPWVGRITC